MFNNCKPTDTLKGIVCEVKNDVSEDLIAVPFLFHKLKYFLEKIFIIFDCRKFYLFKDQMQSFSYFDILLIYVW